MSDLKLLREMIRAILEDANPTKLIVVDDEGIEASIDTTISGDWRKDKDKTIFIATFPLRKGFKQGSELANDARGTKARPRDVMDAIKKGHTMVPGKPYKAELTVTDPARAFAVNLMANNIASRFSRQDVDMVVPVGSSQGLSNELAQIVAQKLGVSDVLSLNKATSVEELEDDQAMFDRYDHWVKHTAQKSYDDGQDNGEIDPDMTFDEYIANMFEHLVDDREHFKSNLKKGKPISTAISNFKTRRKFHNLFKDFELEGHKPTRVLVIDDNVAGGSTRIHALHKLMKAGIPQNNIMFAVGYDYNS